MFTGIVESLATIVSIQQDGTNKIFEIACNLLPQLRVDQSVAHEGVCLTVEKIFENSYQVSAIKETLLKTNLDNWQVGQQVNIERCLAAHSRFDGHIVQGHVDTVAICLERLDQDGSWLYKFKISENFANLIIEKGSIAINGTSLTIFNLTVTEFSVAIIPYTFNHTSISHVLEGTVVNIEFDMIGKYLQRSIQLTENKNL